MTVYRVMSALGGLGESSKFQFEVKEDFKEEVTFKLVHQVYEVDEDYAKQKEQRHRNAKEFGMARGQSMCEVRQKQSRVEGIDRERPAYKGLDQFSKGI